MTKHTPGPWRHVRDRTLSDYDDPGTKWGAASIESTSGCVGQIAHVTHDTLYPDETIANIRLITAAPDLLAACKVLANAGETVEFLTARDPMALSQLREAIAKAEGVEGSIPPVLPEMPRNLVCPACGNDRLLYVEDIGCAREVEKFLQDGTLHIHGLYTTDGYDDGTNARIQCSRCVKEFAVPDRVEFD